MIRGVGVDLVEVARVGKALARWGDRFLRRVFTPEEVADARRGGDFAASLAARFAAKEAAYKAARAPVGRPLALRSIRVSAVRGRPAAITLEGLPLAAPRLTWWCSLAHTGGFACAVVVVEEQAVSGTGGGPASAGAPARGAAEA